METLGAFERFNFRSTSLKIGIIESEILHKIKNCCQS